MLSSVEPLQRTVEMNVANLDCQCANHWTGPDVVVSHESHRRSFTVVFPSKMVVFASWLFSHPCRANTDTKMRKPDKAKNKSDTNKSRSLRSAKAGCQAAPRVACATSDNQWLDSVVWCAHLAFNYSQLAFHPKNQNCFICQGKLRCMVC